MSKDFSPVSKVLGIAFLAIVISAMAQLSYGWSLDQTQEFMIAVVGPGSSKFAANLTQFGPQALLIMAAISFMNKKRRLGIALVIASLLLNALDWYTNAVTFNEFYETWKAQLVEAGRSPEFIDATKPVGQIMVFVVTWFEEGISLALGAALQLWSELADAMGWRYPKFFRSNIVAVGGYNFEGTKNKQGDKDPKRQSNKQQPRDGQQQPAVAPARAAQAAAQRNHRQPRVNNMRRAPMREWQGEQQ